MKKITFILVLGLLASIGNAQEFQWVKKIAGTTATPFSVTIKDIIYNTNEKIIVCGSFSGTVDFDPSTEVSNQIANGIDGFAACYNGSGELLWVHTTNESGNEDMSAGIINYGSAYTRMFTGVVKKGTNSFYLRALNLNNGSVFTTSSTYTSTGSVTINDIDRFSDSSSKYFIAGSYTGTLTVGANSLTSLGLSDAFVASFQTTGSAANQMYNLVFAKKYGGTGNDEAMKLVCTDTSTKVVGYFSNTIDFNLSNPNTITRTSNGGTDCFYMSINDNGDTPGLSTTFSFGGTLDDAATSVALKGTQLVIGGRFRGTVNFNPSGTANNITATGASDGFVTSYNGATHFAVKRGGILDDEVKAVALASAGATIYYISKVGGTTNSSISINAIDGTGNNITTFGGVFTPTNASTLNEPTALVQIGGTNLYTTGIFNTTTNFNPNGSFNLANTTGGNNSFIHKMSACTTSAETPTIIGSGNTLCAGDSRTLTVNSTGFESLLNSNNEWVWYSGTCGSGTEVGRGETITVSPTATTTYYARGEGGCVANGNCSAGKTVIVSANPNSGVTLTGNTLTATQANATYQWIDCNNGNSNITGATSQSYTPTVSGSYAVKVSNISGCMVTSVCTQVNLCTTANTPTVSGNSTVCAGSSVTLSIATGNLNSSTEWKWYSGSCGGTLVGSGTSIIVSPTTTTSYYVRGEGGCSSNGPCSTAKTITVTALPNDAVTLNGTTLLATQGFATYQWIDCNNGNTPIPGATGQSYTNESGGNFAVIITRNGCTVTSACTTVIQCNATVPTVSGTTSICAGDSVTLSITSGNLNSNNLWRWYSGTCGGTTLGTGTSITVTPTTTTNYYVRGEGGNCSTLSTCSSVFTVTVNASPSSTTSLSGSTLTATQASATYQWIDCNNGNQNIPGATSQSFTPLISGNYAVKVTLNGCEVTSTCTQVNVLNNDEFSKLGLTLFPNPAQNYFVIEGENQIEKIEIYNLLGQKVKSFTQPSTQYTIDELSSGTYIIEATTENGVAKTKLVIE